MRSLGGGAAVAELLSCCEYYREKIELCDYDGVTFFAVIFAGYFLPRENGCELFALCAHTFSPAALAWRGGGVMCNTPRVIALLMLDGDGDTGCRA